MPRYKFYITRCTTPITEADTVEEAKEIALRDINTFECFASDIDIDILEEDTNDNPNPHSTQQSPDAA